MHILYEGASSRLGHWLVNVSECTKRPSSADIGTCYEDQVGLHNQRVISHGPPALVARSQGTNSVGGTAGERA